MTQRPPIAQRCSIETPLTIRSSVSIETWLLLASKLGAVSFTGMALLIFQTTTGSPFSLQRLIAMERPAVPSVVTQSYRKPLLATVPFFNETELNLGER